MKGCFGDPVSDSGIVKQLLDIGCIFSRRLCYVRRRFTVLIITVIRVTDLPSAPLPSLDLEVVGLALVPDSRLIRERETLGGGGGFEGSDPLLASDRSIGEAKN
jgi:hypothetical protein